MAIWYCTQNILVFEFKKNHHYFLVNDPKWLEFSVHLWDTLTSTLLSHSGESLWLCPLGTPGQEEVWECHLPIQLILGGKRLATVQLGAAIWSLLWMGKAVRPQLLPIWEGCPRDFTLALHLTLHLPAPRPGNYFPAHFLLLLCILNPGGDAGEKCGHGKANGEGPCYSESLPIGFTRGSLLSQLPTQPSENNLFTCNIRTPGVREPNTMKIWVLEASRAPFQSQPFQLLPWMVSSHTK